MFRIEYQALIEGVDVDRAVLTFVLDDEVAGEADPFDFDTRVSGDLYVDYREGDWDADSPVDNLIEIAVTGVVVLLLVASEVFLFEEDAVEGFDCGLGRCIRGAGPNPPALGAPRICR